MNAMRILETVAAREMYIGVTRHMKYTNGAWNDTHRR